VDQKTKDQITAELAAEYRATVQQTAERDRAERRAGYGPKPKSVKVAFMLWGILGGFGAHRLYLGRIRSGCAMLALGALASVTYSFTSSTDAFLIGAIDVVWCLADAFLIPGMIPNETRS
jgi:TM2 domain-containing membrane protein YozV